MDNKTKLMCVVIGYMIAKILVLDKMAKKMAEHDKEFEEKTNKEIICLLFHEEA